MAEKKKVSKARLEKIECVKEIEKNIKAAKSIVFVDYRGINVSEVSALRGKLKKAGVVFKVYKNNLVRIALNNLGIKALDEQLTGTLAVAFSNNDEISAAKIILEEKFKDKMAFRFGLVGKEVLDAAAVEALAKMPSKETLIAQILGLLTMPARNLATVINAVPRNLAVVVNQRAAQLG